MTKHLHKYCTIFINKSKQFKGFSYNNLKQIQNIRLHFFEGWYMIYLQIIGCRANENKRKGAVLLL